MLLFPTIGWFVGSYIGPLEKKIDEITGDIRRNRESYIKTHGPAKTRQLEADLADMGNRASSALAHRNLFLEPTFKFGSPKK